MLYLNNEPIVVNHFPDNSQKINFDYCADNTVDVIRWRYENDEEFVTLMYITSRMRELGAKKIYLILPYVCNARMDRIQKQDDVFTLKYFAHFLNSLKFDKVFILDPHSNVTPALIDNVVVLSSEPLIEMAFNFIDYRYGSPVIVFPDEGASKKYRLIIPNTPYLFGVKERDWSSREITDFHLIGDVSQLKNKPVLIIDDICCTGDTFLRTAKMLKENGVKDIFLYVTHCENGILNSELLNNDTIKRVFTTDSILNGNHPKIEIYNYDLWASPAKIVIERERE